jgi:hypothetical protein
MRDDQNCSPTNGPSLRRGTVPQVRPFLRLPSLLKYLLGAMAFMQTFCLPPSTPAWRSLLPRPSCPVRRYYGKTIIRLRVAIAYGRSEIYRRTLRIIRPAPILIASIASGTSALHLGLEAIGTCSAANAPAVKHFGAVPIDYRAGDFVAAVGGRSMRGDSVAGSRMLPISRR